MARARTVALVAMLAVAAGCAVGATRAGDAAQPPERAPRAWWPDAGRYVFDLAYYPRRFTLAGTQRISFANTGPVALDAVWLRTWANAFGGCERRRAQIDVLAGGTPAAQRRDCTALQVRLERPLAPGERGEIALRISVTAPPRPDRFGRVGDTAYFGNALPILAVADRDGWRLPPYTFAGESFFSLTSAWEVRLRVAGGLQVASTGTEQARAPDGTLTLTAPRARDFMLVIGPLRVTTRRDGRLVLRRFRLPGTGAREARATLRVARLSMRRFARWYGAYGSPEIDLVEGPRSVAHGGLAMEYPELVLTPSAPIAVAHELAHQWFYAIVGNDQYSEPWLDESFAEFSAGRLPRRTVPDRLGRCRPVPPALRVPLDSTMRRLTRGPPGRYVATVYFGGACTVRALQRALGARRFDAFMRRLVADHRYGVLTTRGFVAALHTAAPDDAAVDRILRRAGIQP